ncbi:MAG TPA: hypothetical protein VF902_09560 [Coriobacteriia bacterium]
MRYTSSDTPVAAHDEPAGSSVGRVFAVVSALAMLALVGGVVALAGATGARGRSEGPGQRSAITVSDAVGLAAAVDASGVRGGVMLQVTKTLDFEPVAVEDVLKPSGYPVKQPEVAGVLAPLVGRANVQWVLSQGSAVRTSVVVMAPSAFASKVDEGRRLGYPGVSADGSSIVANNDGFLRRISARFPAAGDLDGPVILDVAASYFEDATAADLQRALESSGVRPALVILDLAEDDSDVGRKARDELRAFARLLEGGSAGG